MGAVYLKLLWTYVSTWDISGHWDVCSHWGCVQLLGIIIAILLPTYADQIALFLKCIFVSYILGCTLLCCGNLCYNDSVMYTRNVAVIVLCTS